MSAPTYTPVPVATPAVFELSTYPLGQRFESVDCPGLRGVLVSRGVCSAIVVFDPGYKREPVSLGMRVKRAYGERVVMMPKPGPVDNG